MTSAEAPYAAGRQSGVDVAVVGGGLAGTLTALALAQEGCRVALFDLQAEPKPEFRAEQLVGPLVDTLARLGALASMTDARRFEPVTLDTRRGRVIGRTAVCQVALPYEKMVSGARAALPPQVSTTFKRVTGLEAEKGRQVLLLADGSRVVARLLVLATGLSTALPKRLGFSYRTIRRDHSVSLGFDIERQTSRPPLPPLVQHPHSVRDKVDYLAIFPMEERLRANLFSYQEPDSHWVREFCRNPGPHLDACMPGLDRLLGPFHAVAPAQMRSNDLRVVDDPVRDGIVLVGDAFQTPCPAAGTGIDRLLSDVTTLARHAPSWLSTPGMGTQKTRLYYADPEKRRADAEALRIAEYRRRLSSEQTVGWALQRMMVPPRLMLKTAARDMLHALRLRRQENDVSLSPP